MSDSAEWLRGLADDLEGAYGAAKVREIAVEIERLRKLVNPARAGLHYGWDDADDTGHTPADQLRAALKAIVLDKLSPGESK